MLKTLTITPSRCIACRTCEMSCAFKHAGKSGLGISRIQAFMIGEGQNQLLTCFQCAEAACVKVCPVNALSRNEQTDAIDVDEARCIGCGLCAIACPFGHMGQDGKVGVAIKCDLCEGEPACAAFCPTKALEYK